MKIGLLAIIALSLFSGTGFLETNIARAQERVRSDVSAIKEDVDAMKRLLPDQAHGMADVDYHFANLWFAAQNGNWPLAAFYLNETRSHLNWVVRMRPVRKLSAGDELDLRPILLSLENTELAGTMAAIDKRDHGTFEVAYRGIMARCYGCHVAAEKPFLRLRIPEAPATRMIDLQGQAN